MTKNALHSAKDPNWNTPPEILDRCRLALGGEFDLDPLTSVSANRAVRAARIFTEADDGFAQQWVGERVLVNPPGRTVRRSWQKLVDEFRAGRTRQAMWIGFSVEQLCILSAPHGDLTNEQRWDAGNLDPFDFSVAVLRRRISFIKEGGTEGSNPSHGNFVIGLGTRRSSFETAWGDQGVIVHGSLVG